MGIFDKYGQFAKCGQSYDVQERLACVERPLVFWHAPCPDGAMAAYLAKLRWPDAELVGVQYGDPVAVRSESDGTSLVVRVSGRETVAFPLAGRDVLMLDWTPPQAPEVVRRVAAVAWSVVVLDHHQTAIDDFKMLEDPDLVSRVSDFGPNVMILLDKNCSGAGLALDCFHPGSRERLSNVGATVTAPNVPCDERGPGWRPANSWATLLALSVEDRDTWRFQLDGTKEDAAYLDCAGVARDPSKFDGLPSAHERRGQGAAMLRYQQALVDRIAGKAEVCRWAEGEVLVVNTPCLQSEVGEALYRRAPAPLRAAVVWYEDAEGTTVSLRSASEAGALDCAAAAKARGGGGHVHAAGFKVPHRGPWRWSARLDRNVHRDDASVCAPSGGGGVL